MWPFSKDIEEKSVIDNYSPSISGMSSDFLNLAEQFKGEIEQNKIKFPVELGEEHPFDFKQME